MREPGASRAMRWWQEERDLQPAAERRAVDRGDHGLAEGLDPAQPALDAEVLLVDLLGLVGPDPKEVVEVTAGEEGLLGGGDDDAADGVPLGLDAVGDGVEGVDERGVHGVGGLAGVVEHQGDDARVVLLPADGRGGGGVARSEVSRAKGKGAGRGREGRGTAAHREPLGSTGASGGSQDPGAGAAPRSRRSRISSGVGKGREANSPPRASRSVGHLRAARPPSRCPSRLPRTASPARTVRRAAPARRSPCRGSSRRSRPADGPSRSRRR
ncbi:hypothetical protein SANTM175S_10437 [Streptomyces antimycoticus]